MTIYIPTAAIIALLVIVGWYAIGQVIARYIVDPIQDNIRHKKLHDPDSLILFRVAVIGPIAWVAHMHNTYATYKQTKQLRAWGERP